MWPDGDLRFIAHSALDDTPSIQIAYIQLSKQAHQKRLVCGLRLAPLLRCSTRTIAMAVVSGHDFGERSRDGRDHSGFPHLPQTFSARSRTARNDDALASG
ncbi:hypothetical protein BG58_09460 [Caballeronia jiangsuensis]|nr:hypothetical protein BG58_09460 [Caballeronia jiangsuensis]